MIDPVPGNVRARIRREANQVIAQIRDHVQRLVRDHLAEREASAERWRRRRPRQP